VGYFMASFVCTFTSGVRPSHPPKGQSIAAKNVLDSSQEFPGMMRLFCRKSVVCCDGVDVPCVMLLLSLLCAPAPCRPRPGGPLQNRPVRRSTTQTITSTPAMPEAP
jgi:hypothetical protein